MPLLKDELLNVFYLKDLDEGLDPFFKKMGPCTRSEYILDNQKIIDLDWEAFSCVVTLENGLIGHVLLSFDKNRSGYTGWMGDTVYPALKKDEIEHLVLENQKIRYKDIDLLLKLECDNLFLSRVYIQKG